MLSIEVWIDRSGLFLMTNQRCQPVKSMARGTARQRPVAARHVADRCRAAHERRAREMTFMSFHLSSMSFDCKKPNLTWGFAVLHNLNLRHVALLICSPTAHGLRVFGGP